MNHNTAEQLSKWLPGLFALTNFLFCTDSLALSLYTLTGLYPHTHTYYTDTQTHTHAYRRLTHRHTFTHAAAMLFIIYPDCQVTLPLPTCTYPLNYLNYHVPLHIDSVRVLLVYSFVIVILLCYYFIFLAHLSYFLTLHCWERAHK
jgi:hypothetical protein